MYKILGIVILICGINAFAVERTADFKCNRLAAEKMDECNAALEKAINHLKVDKSQFNIKDPDNELRVRRMDIDQFGFKHFRLVQMYKGLRVRGYEITAHCTKENEIKRLGGDFFPNINIDIKPSIDSAQAMKIALDELGLIVSDIRESSMKLIVYIQNEKPYLAWQVNIRKLNGAPFWELFIDATNGRIFEYYDSLDWGDAKDFDD